MGFSSPPPRPPALGFPVMAALGDSRLAFSTTVDRSNPNAPIIAWNSNGLLTWLRMALGHRAHFPYTHNLAVGGSRSDEALARFKDLLALSPRPTMVAILTGANDRSLNYSVDFTVSNVTALANLCRAAGITPFIIADTMRDFSTSSLTAGQISTQRRYFYQSNRRIAAYARTTPGVIYYDPNFGFADPARTDGLALAGLTIDGTHYQIPGGALLGRGAAGVLDGYLPRTNVSFCASDLDIFDALEAPNGNLLLNGTIRGTSGTVTAPATGLVASNYRFQPGVMSGGAAANYTGTVTCTKEDVRTDGKPGSRQVIQFTNWQSAQGAASQDSWTFQQLLLGSTGKFTQGDLVEALADIEVSGAVNINAVTLQVREYDGAAFRSDTRFNDRTSVGAYGPATWAYPLKTDPTPLVAPVAAASQLQFNLLIYGDVRAANGGMSGTIKIGSPSLNKV